MKSKYELTISTSYVPEWTYIESFRELFQNALDNEITNSENKMEFNFDKETGVVSITNKTSVLEIDTLLLGHTTKADDRNTIGRHGEGYKVAFMVLLREGKKIRVYNYGNREIWTARLVKSRKYNGQLVTTVDVEKEAFWKDVPNNNLTVEVSGVTEEEYNKLVEKNLHLRDKVCRFEVPTIGGILTDKEEVGNIYVKGLFVCNNKELRYGYDFEPSVIELDRDRKLVKRIDITWETSAMWKYAFGKKFNVEKIVSMLKHEVADVECFAHRADLQYKLGNNINIEEEVADVLAEDFIDEYGSDSIPVSNNEELNRSSGCNVTTVMVNSTVSKYIRHSDKLSSISKVLSIKEEFEILLGEIESKLDDIQLDKFKGLINRL